MQMLMGVNVNPMNPAGRPDPKMLREIGFGSVRLVLRPGVRDYIDACHAAGLSVLGVIARESGEPGQYADWLTDLLAVGNEMDGDGPSSWRMGPEEYYALWYLTRYFFPDTPLLVGGLCSGNIYRGEQYWCVEGATGVAVHPYGKTAAAARTLICQYRELAEMPVYVTEWNRPVEEIGEFVAMLGQETAGAWWFCWSSQMVSPFGLDEPGKLEAMKEALMNVNISELDGLQQRIELLEKQQALTVAVLKLIVQGKWTGDMPNAEAVLKAISPADADWQAVPFPRS
jgi:hypothetical protein